MTEKQKYYQSKEYKRLWYEKNKNNILLRVNSYRIENREKINRKKIEHRNANKERINAERKVFRLKNPELIKKQKHESYLRNKEKHLEKGKKYVKENREKINKRISIYSKERLHSDPLFKITRNLRNRLWYIIKRGKGKRMGSAVRDLGCSIVELKGYIEKKFTDGMSWKNYTYNGWHLDHIKPLSAFDLSDREQFLKAFHYTNLQPLWMKENLSKGGYKLKSESILTTLS